jgi:hypothetical protein
MDALLQYGALGLLAIFMVGAFRLLTSLSDRLIRVIADLTSSVQRVNESMIRLTERMDAQHRETSEQFRRLSVVERCPADS